MTEHLLIVDDEPDLEIMISHRLRQKVRSGNYVLHFAHNGQEALDKLSIMPQISVVITDISMPIMNGLELLRRINEDHNPALKVVIATAFGDMDNIRFAMNNGAIDFITKPIDLNDLEKVIEKTLELIKTIKQGLQAKQQVDTYSRELLTAKEVQLSMLPKKFPPFADIKQFDIYGQMNAAELVGGDFFDFFLINEDKVGFVIGDVSGKGIPASIFMAVSNTIIRSFGVTDVPTNECLIKSNELLCRISSDNMFVTVFYGILNYKTGELRYTNAGHNYPYLITPDKNNKVIELNVSSNVMLGVFKDATFNENVIQLSPDTMVICYTDGVTEAMNKDKQLLGYEALQNFLNYIPNKDIPQNVTESIFDLVQQHVNGFEQSDDITVLTLSYHG